MAQLVVIKGAGRAFCAGGDVAVLAKQCETGPEGQEAAKAYFALEYKLDHYIATYNKPIVALIDGITMGGGVGLSVHAPFRIATEKTVFAMPETTIGFFPDVGASFFLPKMDGGLGLYLALTSERLKGPENLQVSSHKFHDPATTDLCSSFAGVASHYLDSSSLPDLEARLSELQFDKNASYEERLITIDSTIEEFTTGLPHDKPMHMDSTIRVALDYAFENSIRSIKTVFERLTSLVETPATPENVREWAKKTTATIRERSPTSVQVTMAMLRGQGLINIADAFQQEYHIASRFMEHPDFVTGVTARLIEKKSERPAWQPNTIEEVSGADVLSFFSEDPTALELVDLEGSEDYVDYPYPELLIGLPRENVIESHVAKMYPQGVGPKERAEMHKLFASKYKNKMGVKEKLDEVLDRLLA